MNFESGLVIGCNAISFCCHGLNYWDCVSTFRYFTMLNEYPMHLFDVCIDFLDHDLDEYCSIMLSNGLMHVNNIIHHFCKQLIWILLTLLKFSFGGNAQVLSL